MIRFCLVSLLSLGLCVPASGATTVTSRKTAVCVDDAEIKNGNWKIVPFGLKAAPCLYRLSTEEKAVKGATIIVEAKLKKGKATVFIGTASNVRQQYMKQLTLDMAGSNAGMYERVMPATSTIYVGVDALADTECQIKYEQVIPKTTTTKAANKLDGSQLVGIICGAIVAFTAIVATVTGIAFKLNKIKNQKKKEEKDNQDSKVAPAPTGQGPRSYARHPTMPTPISKAKESRRVSVAWQTSENKIARALLSAFESGWGSCAGVRLAVVAIDSAVVSGAEGGPTVFDVGVCDNVNTESSLDASTEFGVTMGLSSTKIYDVEDNGVGVTLKPHQSADNRTTSIQATQHGLVQLSRASTTQADDAPIAIFKPLSIGRTPRNVIVLKSSYLSVSGRHAEFRFAFVREGWSSDGLRKREARLHLSVADLDSTQGTSVFVRDDRGCVYRKELTDGLVARLDVPPCLRTSGIVSIASQHITDEHIEAYAGCRNTKVGPRLTVIGMQMGTVAFAFQSTQQQYAWDFVPPERHIIRPMTSERAPLPCIDQYLDAFLDKHDYVKML